MLASSRYNCANRVINRNQRAVKNTETDISEDSDRDIQDFEGEKETRRNDEISSNWRAD